MYDNIPFSTLTGLTLTSIEGLKKGSDCVTFTTDTGRKFRMYHYQNCCESVSIEELDGNPNDLLNSPVLFAEKISDDGRGPTGEYDYSYTWTFYRIGTVKGTVVIRWYGTSNGYYSERVDFEEIK